MSRSLALSIAWARRYAVPIIAVSLVVTVLLVLAAADRLNGNEGRHKQRSMLVGSTLVGKFNTPGRTALDALKRESGTPQIVRIFFPSLPSDWATINKKVDNLPVVVSFKASPQQVLAGGYDEFFEDWFAAAPTDRPTYWAFYHEPEDQVESGNFTALEFKQAWQHLADLAAATDNAQLHSMVVLMCWTVSPLSGRDWHQYVDANTADVLAWDCYNHLWDKSKYIPPSQLLTRARAAATDARADWAISELGTNLATGDDGTGRAAWIKDSVKYAEDNQAVFVTYFNTDVGGGFRLTDQPSQAALRAVMAVSRK